MQLTTECALETRHGSGDSNCASDSALFNTAWEQETNTLCRSREASIWVNAWNQYCVHEAGNWRRKFPRRV